MKKAIVTAIILAVTNSAFAGSVQCNATLKIDGEDQALRTEQYAAELANGQASVERIIDSTDHKVSYNYRLQVQNGKIVSGAVENEVRSSGALTSFDEGVSSVTLRSFSASDDSSIEVNCIVR